MSGEAGYTFQLYYSSALIVAAGTGASWQRYLQCTDLDLDPSMDALDATTRGTDGIKEYVPGLLDVKITFKALFDRTDSITSALQTAFYARTKVAFDVHDGLITTSGSKGVRGNYQITKWKPAPPIDGLATFDAEACPAVNSYVQVVTI